MNINSGNECACRYQPESVLIVNVLQLSSKHNTHSVLLFTWQSTRSFNGKSLMHPRTRRLSKIRIENRVVSSGRTVPMVSIQIDSAAYFHKFWCSSLYLLVDMLCLHTNLQIPMEHHCRGHSKRRPRNCDTDSTTDGSHCRDCTRASNISYSPCYWRIYGVVRPKCSRATRSYYRFARL